MRFIHGLTVHYLDNSEQPSPPVSINVDRDTTETIQDILLELETDAR